MANNRQTVQAIRTPSWLEERADLRGFKVMLEAINEQLEKQPNISLAEFAKLVDETLFEESFRRWKKTVYSQFDKE